jgi:diguanylate cyclase (GGDEF)-like protein
MRAEVDPNVVGLATQAIAVALMAVLSVLLTRSTRSLSLRYWTGAWCCLVVALTALIGNMMTPGSGRVLYPIYLFGKWAFCYLVLAGCRSYAHGVRLKTRDAWLIVAGSGLAIALPAFTGWDPRIFFIPHAAIVAAFFAYGFWVLRIQRKQKLATPGVRVMSTALLLLAVVFLHYIPIFGYAAFRHVALPVAYLQYSTLYHLILEVLLGFGMVMQVMEELMHELEWSNRQLTRARDQMEVLARIDPLTETLNRNGLYYFIEHRQGSGLRSGCVALVDMDDLKQINDSLGHAAGDAAIRALAKAIRSLIRPDDLLIRWGGDEFLVLLFGVSQAEARRRLEGLIPAISSIALPGSGAAVSLSVSCGIAPFSPDTHFDSAIEQADNAMYAEKQRHRLARGA